MTTWEDFNRWSKAEKEEFIESCKRQGINFADELDFGSKEEVLSGGVKE